MKRLAVITAALFILITISQAQKDVSTTIYPSSYRYWTIAPIAGVTFPAQTLSNNYNTGFNIGVDVGYRMNQSFGLFSNVTYHNLSGRDNFANANYVEISAARMFIGGKANSSALWLEGGIGAFNFNNTGIAKGPTNAGLKFGVGGSIPISNTVSLMAKGDYNHIFTANAPSSFASYNAGIRFILR